MSENRRDLRKRTLKGGRIVFNEARSTIDCTVRNLSPAGAKLMVTSVVGIPDTFELMIGTEKPRVCRMIWRTGKELGVAFLAQ